MGYVGLQSRSIKNSLREARGEGIRRQILPRSPRNWSDFLRNNHNKEDLFYLLGKHAVDNVRTAQVVTNIGAKYVCSANASTSLTGLSCTSFEEADGRIILHARDAVLHGAKTVVIRTVDTDVLVLAISFYFDLKTLGLEELWVSIGTGKNKGTSRLTPLLCHSAQRNLLLFGASTHSQDVTLFLVLHFMENLVRGTRGSATIRRLMLSKPFPSHFPNYKRMC